MGTISRLRLADTLAPSSDTDQGVTPAELAVLAGDPAPEPATPSEIPAPAPKPRRQAGR